MITITYMLYTLLFPASYSEFCLYLCIIPWAGWDLSMQELHYTVKHSHTLTTTTSTATTIITYIKITIYFSSPKLFFIILQGNKEILDEIVQKCLNIFRVINGVVLFIYLVQTKCLVHFPAEDHKVNSKFPFTCGQALSRDVEKNNTAS